MVIALSAHIVTACNKIALIFRPRFITFHSDRSVELYLKLYNVGLVSTGDMLIICSISKGFLYGKLI